MIPCGSIDRYGSAEFFIPEGKKCLLQGIGLTTEDAMAMTCVLKSYQV